MAHIINKIDVRQRLYKNLKDLSSMTNCPKSIYDSKGIQQRIEQAAKIRNQLDTDIFERDKRIA